jgi:CheY-like chemotaxis protein
MLILVADDNHFGADTWARGIQIIGQGKFLAEAVYGGLECLNRLERQPVPDVILLDIDMPDINGAMVIRKIWEEKKLTHCRIIPVTAWGSNWIERWNLSDIKDDPFFKRLGLETYDKADFEVETLLERLSGLGEKDGRAA